MSNFIKIVRNYENICRLGHQIINHKDFIRRATPEKVNEELAGKGVSKDAIDKLQSIIQLSGTSNEKLSILRAFLSESEIGLKGIEESYELPHEADDNLWSLNRTEARSSGLRQLPQDLRQALDLMEDSELVANALGEHIFEWFLRNKRSEWELYQGRVTPFELEQYLPVW